MKDHRTTYNVKGNSAAPLSSTEHFNVLQLIVLVSIDSHGSHQYRCKFDSTKNTNRARLVLDNLAKPFGLFADCLACVSCPVRLSAMSLCS